MTATGYGQDWRFQRALGQKARAQECARQEQIKQANACVRRENQRYWEAILEQTWIEQQEQIEWIERQNAIAIQCQERIERENYWAEVRAYRAQLWREEHPESYQAQLWREEHPRSREAQQWREEHPYRE